MKNQYLCDIGDYGKYSLLRAFTDAGISVGINWYHTEDDDTNDGKFKTYLSKDEYRGYDPLIFDELRKLNEKRKVIIDDIQQSKIFSNTSFYSELLAPVGTPKERAYQREEWFKNSIHALRDSDLIFLDPDNGLLISDNSGVKKAHKYALPSEVKAYYCMGHNVVYYCHRGRRNDTQWNAYVTEMMNHIYYAYPIVITFHKGTQRSFVFWIHRKDYKRTRSIIDTVLEQWNGLYTDEDIDEDTRPVAIPEMNYYPGIFDEFKNNSNLDDWCDKFPDVMWKLGFDMDSNESFAVFKKYCEIELKVPKTRQDEYRNILYLLEHANRHIIGNYLFSEWRYLTHWSMCGFDKYDSDFCQRIIKLLEKTYKEEGEHK